ncbi:conserved domain protein, partial [Trichinella spiralis]|uniref:hypothetical protein n=1 Tax=Trichinella spiralis TaxID=6334 RepID=UPI0001EFE689
THQVPHQFSITGTCIKQSFTISYMNKFICIEESGRNAYIGLTEEERQHWFISKLTVARYLRSMTTQDRDVVETKQSHIHFHRKMHRLLTTLWSNSSAAMNALAIIQRLIKVRLRTKNTATLARFVKRDEPLLITEWNDSSAASKAEQLRDAVCRSSIVLLLAVLNKVLSLTLPLSTPLQVSRLDVLQC